jgi:5-oxoprolinase (ATP-hydrolysing) subunit A
MRTIDLNADLGEGYGPWKMGDDSAMLDIVSSANVACGGHASDPETMFATLKLAQAKGIVVGAHPSYPDKEGFGRRRLPFSGAEIERFVAAQVGALMGIAALAGATVCYVKVHGALANVASEDAGVATAVVNAVAAVDTNLALLAISGTQQEKVARARNIRVFSEIYADRGYGDDGNLVPRIQPGAMIDDTGVATDRLLRFLESGKMPTVTGGQVNLDAESICIHGDSPHAVAMAAQIKAALVARGMAISPFLKSI